MSFLDLFYREEFRRDKLSNLLKAIEPVSIQGLLKRNFFGNWGQKRIWHNELQKQKYRYTPMEKKNKTLQEQTNCPGNSLKNVLAVRLT